ncbi:substrate-binding domain-containing protein [Chloroflexi bacterium TSY]|nr:substrate-binding domain-containing protein [Chloroflexi bacterium TSY]
MKTNRSMSRRDFLRATGLVAGSAALAACVPGGGSAPSSSDASGAAAEGGTIRYWFNWGGNYAGQTWDAMQETDTLKEILGDFVLEIKGSIGDEALLTAVSAGTPPEGASNVQYLDYMARGVLVPIADMVEASDIISKEKYLEGSWNDGFDNEGVHYGVPANEGFLRYALNYNAEMVGEAGLDPDTPPETWDELMVWHETLTQFDDAGNLKQIGLDPYDAMGGNLAIQDGFYPAVSWGFSWFDPASGEFNLDNEMLAQAFETMGAFYDVVGPDNMAGMRQVEGQGMWGGSYNSRVQAIMIDGYWRPGGSFISKPDVGQHNRAVWAPVPADRKGVRVQGTGGHYVILYQEAAHTDKMFEVSEFLNTNEACDIIFANAGWLPGLTSYLETVDSETYPGLKFYFDSIEEATEWSSPARCPITEYCRAQWNELRENVYRKDLTGAEAAAEFQTRATTEYEAVFG